MPTQPAANAARGTYPRRIAPRLNEKYKNNIFLKPKRLIFRLAREMGERGGVALSGRALFLFWLRRPILDDHCPCDRRRLCSSRARHPPPELNVRESVCVSIP